MVTFASPPLLTQLHTCAWPWLWRKYWKNAPVRRPSLYSICSSYLPACNTGALTSRQPSPGYSLLSFRVYPPSMVDTVEGKLALLGIHPSTCPWFSCPDHSFTSSLFPCPHSTFSSPLGDPWPTPKCWTYGLWFQVQLVSSLRINLFQTCISETEPSWALPWKYGRPAIILQVGAY